MISISQFMSEIVLIPSIDAHKEKRWPPWALALVFKVLPLLLKRDKLAPIFSKKFLDQIEKLSK